MTDERLQRLLDKEDIREVLLRYTRGIDRHDVEIMSGAYHADATDDHGTFNGSAAEFIQYANAVHADGFLAHHHYIGNQTIELDGACAYAETYYLASLRRKDGATVLVGGRYIDRLEHRDNGWAIVHRKALIEWAGDLVRSDFTEGLVLDTGRWDRSDISYAPAAQAKPNPSSQ